MDSIAFTLGSFDVTYGLFAIFGGLGLVVLVGLAIAILVALNRGQSEEAAKLAKAEVDSFATRLIERDTRIKELEQQLDHQRRANSSLQSEAAALKAQMGEQQKQAEESLKRYADMREQMTQEFKLVANNTLQQHGEAFTKLNREQVETLLKPLNEKIGDFHKNLMQDRAAMSEQIRALAESNLQITTEAHNLTRALKGNTQTQGAWGEMILTTILERSGLKDGEHFMTQQSYQTDDGGRVRTDVEVMMPNGDSIVIDSKVSLNAFEAFTNCEDETERRQHLQAHLASLRNHIKILSGKDYHRHARSGLDFVLMFVPIESSYSLAVTEDPLLFEAGAQQGVYICTPATLMSILRTVRNVWDMERRHKNAEDIAKRAGQLYEKVVSFANSMDKIERGLGQAQQAFDSAKGQLTSGRGSVIRQLEMLKEMGAQTSKSLPDDWTREAGESPRLPQADEPVEQDN